MNIELSQIKPSPKPIRTTWDEDKLNELAQSIEEQGLIVPIKVRPNAAMKNFIAEIPGWYKLPVDNRDMSFDEYKEKKINSLVENPYGWDKAKFEIVYGHRRVAALRIAGFNETDAIVEGVDDTDLLIQSLIENVQREDMNPIDTANALQSLKDETGWSINEFERQGIMDAAVVSQYLSLLKESPEIQKLIGKKSGGVGSADTPLAEIHVREVRRTGLSQNERTPILEKAAKEKLSHDQTRKVAESVAATKDPKKRKYLLDTEFSSFVHDPEIVAFEESIPKEKSKPDLGSAFDPTPEVGWILEYLSAWTKKVDKFDEATEAGKFSPEARAFTARRAQKFVNKLSEWIEVLEG